MHCTVSVEKRPPSNSLTMTSRDCLTTSLPCLAWPSVCWWWWCTVTTACWMWMALHHTHSKQVKQYANTSLSNFYPGYLTHVHMSWGRVRVTCTLSISVSPNLSLMQRLPIISQLITVSSSCTVHMQYVQSMSTWGELQIPVSHVQQWAPLLGVWSGCVLAWMVLGGSMKQTHHCHVWVSSSLNCI